MFAPALALWHSRLARLSRSICAQAGYNVQYSQFVLAETDLQWPAADDTFALVEISNPWFVAPRARLARNSVMFYEIVGLPMAH
jgi:hypothetical protein